MEEKINNQKIFSYVPPTVAKLIIDSNLKDSDVFFNVSNINKSNKDLQDTSSNSDDNSPKNKSKNKELLKKKIVKRTLERHNSEFIKPNVFPISHYIEHSLIMIIRLKGFEKLISSLIIKDKENKKEKLYGEYLSILISRLLLKISGVLSENGGEIIKYNDFEMLVIWNFSTAPQNKVLKYKKFYSKYALISAIEIMKKFDDSEILGTKIEISIGIGLGPSDIIFFGGERKRSEYVVLGEAIEQAELCIENSLEHEIIISKEINNLFKMGQELITRELKNELEQKCYFAVDGLYEDVIKNFEAYKGIKLNNNNIYMNKNIYENLTKKVYILSSILPQGLIKYLDVGKEEDLKEICNLTIETIQISISLDLMDDINLIQNLILDIQKATYMTFGSLLYITKTYNGFLIRCAWGIDPGNFIDNTSRAISTSILIGSLTNHYNIKIGIGISTGACFTGLINIQGNRKLFTLIGKKVNFSRTMADEAISSVIKSQLKYLIYCDKLTMKFSQNCYRQSFVSKIKIYFDRESDLYFKLRDDFFTGVKNTMLKKENKERKPIGNFKKRRKTRREIVQKSKSIDIKDLKNYNDINEKYEIGPKQNKLIQEIFSPIENDEYFLPCVNDPFPLIRTHLYNSFNPMNNIENFSMMNTNTNNEIKNFMMNYTIKQEQMTEKKKKKLKKSQTIFCNSKELKKLLSIMNNTMTQKKKQFIAIRGPYGVGKSLFLRKALNNFIGLNDRLSRVYFVGKEFLFCNIMNPFTSTLPYNTVSFILRKIYFYLSRYSLIKALFHRTKNLNLENEDFEHINYILSIGKNDINVKEDFKFINKEKKSEGNSKQKKKKKKNEEIPLPIFRNFSVISRIEGPYKYNNIDKLNMFFYEMIKIYKSYLQKTFSVNNLNDFICPLIFVIEDVQKSNNYSFEFIKFLFSKEDSSLNPFILILIEQTPLHYEYNSSSQNKSMETFISSFSDYNSLLNPDKILSIDIKPINDKTQLERLIIFYFKDLVLNNYKTNLEKVDDQILEFLLHKSFNGIPLLVISLFKSLIKSEKFVQTLSAEFIITSDLIDDNKMLDWSDILIPYEYEKIGSMKINSVLNFKETLIFKYACIIGTIFDLQTLDKLNPLFSIVKTKDLEKVMEKLDKEHIIEIFYDFKNSDRMQNIFCKISFPFMREVFQQKFPIEFRKILHMKVAKIISTDKKINYFSTENNILILNRHLLNSELDVINETETKKIILVKDILENKQVLNYNNLKILLVKELYSRFCYPTSGLVLEGNLELYYKSKWLRVSYYIERKGKIYFNQKDLKKGTLTNILVFSIEDIYKNHILKNVDENRFKCSNVLEISVSISSKPLTEKNKKIYYCRSEQREELSKLDIAINFLRVKVNYEKFVNYYGELKFPLYKLKWFVKNKANKYYSNIESRRVNKRKSIYNIDNTYTDKLIDESNNYYKSLSILFNSTISIFLGTIQENIIKNSKKIDIKEEKNITPFAKEKIIYNYLKLFTIPEHLRSRINKFLKALVKKGIIIDRPEDYNFENSIYEQLINKLNKSRSSKNNSKKLKNSQKKVTVKDSNKSSKRNKRKNKTVENDKLKTINRDNDLDKGKKPQKDAIALKKKIDIFYSEDEISFSDLEKNNNINISSSKTDENSFNSILKDLSAKGNIKPDKYNNKSRNPKNTKTKHVKILDQRDFIPLTERKDLDKGNINDYDTRSTKSTKNQKFNTIYNLDIGNLMSNKYKNEMNFKTISDDPRYDYIGKNNINANKKIHISNLFLRLQNKTEIK